MPFSRSSLTASSRHDDCLDLWVKSQMTMASHVPKLVSDIDVFFRNGISFIVARLLSVSEISSSRVKISSHDVPAQSSTSEMVHSAESAGKMIRLFISGRHGYTETDIFSSCCHGWHSSEGFIDRPLRAWDDGGIWIARAFVYIIRTLKMWATWCTMQWE